MTMTDMFCHKRQGTPDVGIIGLGYVGLTLAIALAETGLTILGYDSNPTVIEALSHEQVPFFEPHLQEGLQQTLGQTFVLTAELPETLPAIVILCVGTPLYKGSHTPDFRDLEASVHAISTRVQADTLIIIRSTVSVGTSRALAQQLQQRLETVPHVAFCPERTIQGKALEELHTLPQIVGGLTSSAIERAKALFARLTPYVHTVSSLEAAETIKLICNAHTDLIYGFGNQVALIAEALALDARELIHYANLHYPRPDLARPGFVGGSCLSKDPYLLIHSVQSDPAAAALVKAARSYNESLPAYVGSRVLAALQRLAIPLAQAKICLMGFAYKGQPETDDIRGAPTEPILATFRGYVHLIVGHDFVVEPQRLRALEVEPLPVMDAIDQAAAVLVLNDHPRYCELTLQELTARMHHPGVFFDAWSLFVEQEQDCHPSVQYMRLGHG